MHHTDQFQTTILVTACHSRVIKSTNRYHQNLLCPTLACLALDWAENIIVFIFP